MSTVATLKGLKCPQCGSEAWDIKGKAGGVGASMAGTLLGGAIVSLAVSSHASKNVKTDPIAFVCKSCKHKFQTMPLCAPEEDIIDAPCTVNFTRLRSFVGAAVAQMVYLNGVNCGPVKNGKTITLQTSSRWNTIFVTDQYGAAFPGAYHFEAVPGGTIEVKFNRKFVE
ncbi:MAG: hypothetical protein LBN26_09975 [Christensenellaceae bacterium]|jgi:hypothetical protein|nr:hypothetical protein [Christensenellaceae bacterium]